MKITGYATAPTERDGKICFSLAENLGKGEQQKTTWFSCQSTKNSLEACRRVCKGDKIEVSGFLTTNLYKEKVYCNVMVFEIAIAKEGSKVGAPDRGLHSDEPAEDSEELPF